MSVIQRLRDDLAELMRQRQGLDAQIKGLEIAIQAIKDTDPAPATPGSRRKTKRHPKKYPKPPLDIVFDSLEATGPETSSGLHKHITASGIDMPVGTVTSCLSTLKSEGFVVADERRKSHVYRVNAGTQLPLDKA